jgi:hypothetical protein
MSCQAKWNQKKVPKVPSLMSLMARLQLDDRVLYEISTLKAQHAHLTNDHASNILAPGPTPY